MSILISSFLVRILPYRPHGCKLCNFVFEKLKNSKCRLCCMINNLACSSCTGQYFFSLVLTVWTLLHSFCTATTLGQTSPVPPSPQVIILWDQDLVHYVMLYVVHVLLCTVLFGRGRGHSNVKMTGAIVRGFAKNPETSDFLFPRDTLQVILNQDKKITAIF